MGVLDTVLGYAKDAFNIWQQMETQKYMKSVQEKTWEREDNAVQRRSVDLAKAGINPLLAAGQAASSSAPISVGTVQAGPSQGLEARMLAQSMLKQKQDIAVSAAEEARIVQDTQAKSMENAVTKSFMDKYTELGGRSQPVPELLGQWRFESAEAERDRAIADARAAKSIAEREAVLSEGAARDLAWRKENKIYGSSDAEGYAAMNDYLGGIGSLNQTKGLAMDLIQGTLGVLANRIPKPATKIIRQKER